MSLRLTRSRPELLRFWAKAELWSQSLALMSSDSSTAFSRLTRGADAASSLICWLSLLRRKGVVSAAVCWRRVWRKPRPVGRDRVRALVRRDNATMQSLCRRRGFQSSTDLFVMYVVDAQPFAAKARHLGSHLVRVDTLGYAGLWLEGALRQAAIYAARRLATQCGASIIGAVIPSADMATAALLEANAFANVGQYNWWSINLRNDRS